MAALMIFVPVQAVVTSIAPSVAPSAAPVLTVTSECVPVASTTKRQCKRKIKTCFQQNIIMKWGGRGSRIGGVVGSDGGCQCDG